MLFFLSAAKVVVLKALGIKNNTFKKCCFGAVDLCKSPYPSKMFFSDAQLNGLANLELKKSCKQ
jgi:hypothetical protein